jgi:hypothetical protein
MSEVKPRSSVEELLADYATGGRPEAWEEARGLGASQEALDRARKARLRWEWDDQWLREEVGADAIERIGEQKVIKPEPEPKPAVGLRRMGTPPGAKPATEAAGTVAGWSAEARERLAAKNALYEAEVERAIAEQKAENARLEAEALAKIEQARLAKPRPRVEPTEPYDPDPPWEAELVEKAGEAEKAAAKAKAQRKVSVRTQPEEVEVRPGLPAVAVAPGVPAAVLRPIEAEVALGNALKEMNERHAVIEVAGSKTVIAGWEPKPGYPEQAAIVFQARADFLMRYEHVLVPMQVPGKRGVVTEFHELVPIPVHRGQSFRRIADSVPVIADSC